ncbi:MAG: hypothetical protein HY376_00865 [Candidatus Blackburnbacteria bacterium]|nr:hypothetical protein [Candidatus Blackburnbacteria bacterium]
MVVGHQDDGLIGHALWAVLSQEGKGRAWQAIQVLLDHGRNGLARLLADNLRRL